MSIAQDLKHKLNQNQRQVYITDADDLLAVWRYKKENTFKCSVNFSKVPREYRLSFITAQ